MTSLTGLGVEATATDVSSFHEQVSIRTEASKMNSRSAGYHTLFHREGLGLDNEASILWQSGGP